MMNKKILIVLLATVSMINNAQGFDFISKVACFRLEDKPCKIMNDIYGNMRLKNPSELLHRAVVENDAVVLKYLLDKKIDVNSRALFKVPGKDLIVELTPLQMAVICGHVNIGGELLRRGATIETVQGIEDVCGNWSTLASNELLTNLCKIFLTTTLELNINNEENNNVLIDCAYACSDPEWYLEADGVKNDYKTGKIKLKAYMKMYPNLINKQNCKGFTPLTYILTYSDVCGEAVELLLKAGADASLADGNGKTPLQAAIYQATTNKRLDILMNIASQLTDQEIEYSIKSSNASKADIEVLIPLCKSLKNFKPRTNVSYWD